MKIDINELTPNLISFKAYELKECKLFWHNPSLLKSMNIETASILSYATLSNQYINKSRLNLDKEITFTGERYGGKGIGTNGGGARCGNYNNLQYKGIGSNILANSTTNHSHTNGTLSLLDGVTEAIYSEVLSHILPNGVVKVIGLINTGKDTAYCNYSGKGSKNITAGAILIRETCIRPAHFFPIPYYQSKENDSEFNDVIRIKKLHRLLAKKFKDFDDFAKYVGQVMNLHANQFAFSRIARISHGAVTPSNISLSGQWLDLNTINFLDSNKNYTTSEQQVPFHQESDSINQIFQELVYTFCKYNNLNFSSKSLSLFYKNNLNQMIEFHTPWVLGLDRDIVNGDIGYISQYIMKAISADSNIVFALSYIKTKDPMTLLISSLFESVFNRKKTLIQQPNSDINNHFIKLLRAVYQKNTSSGMSFFSFLIQTYLIASKRSYFHQVFNRNRITELVIPMINTTQLTKLPLFIDQITKASTWIFDDSHTKLTKIFSSVDVLITYNSTTETFEFNNLLIKDTHTFKYAYQLKEFMQTEDNTRLETASFNFKPDLIEILGHISHV